MSTEPKAAREKLTKEQMADNLCLYARNNRLDDFQNLISQGLSVNTPCQGIYPIHCAAKFAAVDVLKAIITMSVNNQQPDFILASYQGKIALEFAQEKAAELNAALENARKTENKTIIEPQELLSKNFSEVLAALEEATRWARWANRNASKVKSEDEAFSQQVLQQMVTDCGLEGTLRVNASPVNLTAWEMFRNDSERGDVTLNALHKVLGR